MLSTKKNKQKLASSRASKSNNGSTQATGPVKPRKKKTTKKSRGKSVKKKVKNKKNVGAASASAVYGMCDDSTTDSDMPDMDAVSSSDSSSDSSDQDSSDEDEYYVAKKARKNQKQSEPAAATATSASATTAKQKLANSGAGASKSNNGSTNTKRPVKPRKKQTNKRKSRRGKRVKKKKHAAEWTEEEQNVKPEVRGLPQHTWRQRPLPRGTCATPWSTLRKVFLTDELVKFAVHEFNFYPKSLAAQRTRPSYIPEGREWPPKWVNQVGSNGPMHLTPEKFLKMILILFLLGAKGLSNTNLDDMFSINPIMREHWLCNITTRREIGRFLRQVSVNVLCVVFVVTLHLHLHCLPRGHDKKKMIELRVMHL